MANECVLLGTQLNHTWKLYDNIDNPAHGVVLTYYKGSYLPGISDDDNVYNYGLQLSLICMQHDGVPVIQMTIGK